jgi:acyl-coenzyme A thioesterase PaaI-like protein
MTKHSAADAVNDSSAPSVDRETPAPCSGHEESSEFLRRRRRQQFLSQTPAWLTPDFIESLGTRLCIPEWETDAGDDDKDKIQSYRSSNGWKGRDYCHDSRSSPVYIKDYYLKTYNTHADNAISHPSEKCNDTRVNDATASAPATMEDSTVTGGVGTTLSGVVYFTTDAESHPGYCHGGSMTAVMDDVIGWVGFCAQNVVRPWSGYTVQVNCKLQQPVSVESILLVRGRITKIEGRKVFVQGELLDPSTREGEDVTVHAQAEGIFILNRQN